MGFLGTQWISHRYHVQYLLSSCLVITCFRNSVYQYQGHHREVVFLTLAVGTSVPGDFVAHRLVSREGQAGENIPSVNF